MNLSMGWSKYDFYIIHLMREAQQVMIDRFCGLQAPSEVRLAMQNTGYEEVTQLLCAMYYPQHNPICILRKTE